MHLFKKIVRFLFHPVIVCFRVISLNLLVEFPFVVSEWEQVSSSHQDSP